MFGREKHRTGKLRIIIVGCGKVGITITERLIREGHDITVIDQSAELIARVTDRFDVMGIVGNGASFNVQAEAGVEKADMLVAVTKSDELNLLCCMVAKRVGHCEVIARVRTPEYSEEADYLREQLGLAMAFNPDKETANVIANNLFVPTAISVNSLAGGRAELIRVNLDDKNLLCGKKIMDLGKELAGAVLICAVERGGQVYIPDGSFSLQKGDVVTFITPRKGGARFLTQMGFQNKEVKDAILVGGSRIAFYLAQTLLAEGIHVKIIERDRNTCERLSTMLPGAVIICGDGTSEEILKETGLYATEALVTLTNIDEENILLGLHAQQTSDAKVITKISGTTYQGVLDSLKLGSVVFPKYITADAIVAYVRSQAASMEDNIETLVNLFNDRVEAVEFLVKEQSAVTNTPLYRLKLKSDLLVTCINRRGWIIIPGGKDEIQVGDSVIIVTTHGGMTDIREILA